MQSITDPRGAAVVTNTYDSNDRITQQTLADGSTFKLAYTLGSSANVVETDVTDPRGFLRKVTFNSAGWVMTDKSAVGTPQEADFSYTRDPTTNYTTSISDPLGRTLATSFDTNGNLTSITQLAGTSSAATTNFTYSPAFNQLTSMTDPLGHTTTYQRGVFDELTAVVDPLGNTTHYNYNSAGQVVTATDPLNNVTTYAYDHGDLASVQVPLLRTTKFYTDPIGRRLSAADPLGNVSQWAYDPYDGISQATDANGNTTSLTYAPIGRVATVTDPRGGVISYTYDSRWRALTRTDAAGAVASITGRDGNSNILTEVDRKGQSATYAYDPMNRQVSATYAGGATLSWTYDLAGRLTQAQDSVGGTVTRSYDGFDHLLSETTPQGTVSYTYDAAGRRTTMIASGQPQVTYSYDNANRLTGITQSGSTVTFGYDAASRRVSAALPGGVSAAYAYDNASQLLSITYTSGTSTLGTLTYGYDLAGHVVARGGSLFQSVLPASVSSATYNIANRMTQRVAAGVTITPAWDANGSLTSDGLRSYSWDSRNRLTTITGLATFAYDAFGRRSSATIGGIATAYLYDGWDVVQEQQGGTASANLLSGLGIDEPLSRAGATYLTDALGSTVALVNGGVVKTSYGYDPYGSTNVSGTASTNAHQFAGRENDGTGLYAYRNRYYNPAWARFVSEDPIGLAGGINLYAYANNNPIQLRDPFGFNPSSGDQSGGQGASEPGLGTPADQPQPGDKDPRTPTGQRGSPINVKPGTNAPATIGGRVYTGHALDQMQGRGVPPTAVEDAIQNGVQSPGNRPGTTVNAGSNGVTVVTGESGQVITVITK